MDARAEERVALVAFDLEQELVSLHLREARADDDRAARRGGGKVADVNLLTDRGVVGWKQAFYRAMAGPLHETDHGRRREGALATHVAGQKIALDDTLHATLDTGPDPLESVHHIDCR